jgi:hypothetical protein
MMKGFHLLAAMKACALLPVFGYSAGGAGGAFWHSMKPTWNSLPARWRGGVGPLSRLASVPALIRGYGHVRSQCREAGERSDCSSAQQASPAHPNSGCR